MLQNKTILLVSPQSWGKMFVSKHHYAVELTRQGNKVYFLNPPEQGSGEHKHDKSIVIEPSGEYENLFIIHHHLWFPYNLKFHLMGLFHLLVKPHVKNIVKTIGKPVDVVWSFDIGNLYPFDCFPDTSYKIFHPVDSPASHAGINAAKNADIIFSVTREILAHYEKFKIPSYFINHGVAQYFAGPHLNGVEQKTDNRVHVGFSGNLLREDIDRETFVRIILENPDVVFECWGSYQLRQSNIGGKDDSAVKKFIHTLQECPNVKLHGVVEQAELARELRRMDAFLICYNIDMDQSKGTNYHKVMEYISTGKVIISNNISTYDDQPILVQMLKTRGNNDELPALFKKIIADLDTYNQKSWQKIRVEYATKNYYHSQLEKIDSLIEINNERVQHS